MTSGTVSAIHLAPAFGAPVRPVERAEAVAGAGLVGDRYFQPGAPPTRQLTLVEAEELARLEDEHGIVLPPGGSRRQVTTTGVRLNDLVGHRFRVGPVECRGVELCEPCNNLQKATGVPGLMRAFAHRAGLNAELLGSGEIAVGDAIAPLA